MLSHVAYRIYYTFFIFCVEIFQFFSFNFEKFRRELTWIKILKFRHRLMFTFRMIKLYWISIFNRFENIRVRIIQILIIQSTHVVNNAINEKTQKIEICMNINQIVVIIHKYWKFEWSNFQNFICDFKFRKFQFIQNYRFKMFNRIENDRIRIFKIRKFDHRMMLNAKKLKFA